MASFSFDFLANELPSDEAVGGDKSNSHDQVGLQVQEEEDDDASRPPFCWWSADEVGRRSQERALEEIVYTEIPVVPSKSTVAATVEEDATSGAASSYRPLCCVDLKVSSFAAAAKEPNDDAIKSNNEACWKQTDLVPKVYEGGMKVWECSLDLVHHLAVASDSHDDLLNNNKRQRVILELGCGHGLPSCFLLREMLLRQNNHDHDDDTANTTTFFLTDFNDFVLRDATLSNLVLNVAHAAAVQVKETNDNCEQTIKEQQQHAKAVASILQQHVRLGYGDWLNMSKQLLLMQQDEHESEETPCTTTFDLILAAETVYSDQAAQETALLLQRHLHPSTGVALVATKRYYFGVGGGSDAFTTAAAANVCDKSSYELQVETIRVYNDGASNIRELLQVRKVPRPAKMMN